MNKQDKINAIYKEIANKELSFGCKIIIECTTCSWDDIYPDTIKARYLQWDWKFWSEKSKFHWDLMVDWELSSYSVKLNELWETPWNNTFEIIWHSVLIWDVLDYWQINWLWLCSMNDISEAILLLWENKRLPINEQSEECINYIYNLIK